MEEPLQKSLERYDVLDRIAVGGMAEVFLAKAYGAHGFEKTLAIKRILPELASDPEFAARFIAEAKVAVRLSHANVVQVFDFGRIGGWLGAHRYAKRPEGARAQDQRSRRHPGRHSRTIGYVAREAH